MAKTKKSPTKPKKSEQENNTPTQKELIRDQMRQENKLQRIITQESPHLFREVAKTEPDDSSETPDDKKKMGRPKIFGGKEDLQNFFKEYMASCFRPKLNMFGSTILDEEDQIVWEQFKPYTLQGFDAFVGWTRETRSQYAGDPEFSDTLEQIKGIVYAYNVESLWKSSSSGVVFSLKNNFGWVDKIIQENRNLSLDDVLDAQEDEEMILLDDAMEEVQAPKRLKPAKRKVMAKPKNKIQSKKTKQSK